LSSTGDWKMSKIKGASRGGKKRSKVTPIEPPVKVLKQNGGNGVAWETEACATLNEARTEPTVRRTESDKKKNSQEKEMRSQIESATTQEVFDLAVGSSERRGSARMEKGREGKKLLQKGLALDAARISGQEGARFRRERRSLYKNSRGKKFV